MTDRRFHIEACLGKGGFGEVYRARMVRGSGFELDVALKLLRADVDPRGQAAQRLRDEARMLGMVRHRAIPKVHDLVVVDGRLALISEYIEGADLSACLKVTPRLSTRAIAEVVGTVADALHAAWHTRLAGREDVARIVHRDLKPANIRISRDGSPMLLDFGIAWTDAVTRVALTQTSALVGSPAYMAPERFEGTPPSPANDIFSLGAVLWESVVGSRLFAEVSFQELAGLSLFEERFRRAIDTRLAMVPRELDEGLHELLGAMLAWKPEQRPDAAEVAATLEQLVPTLPGPSLRAWCQAHDWDAQPHRQGPWVGRVVSEAGALAPVAAEAEPEAPAPRDLSRTYDTSTDMLDVSVEAVTTHEAVPTDTIRDVTPTPAPLLPPSPARRSTAPWTMGAVALGAAIALVVSLVRATPVDEPPVIEDDHLVAEAPAALEPVSASLITPVDPEPTPAADTVPEPPTPAPATPRSAPARTTPPKPASAPPRLAPAPRQAVILPSVDTLLGPPDPVEPAKAAVEPVTAAPSRPGPTAPALAQPTMASAPVAPPPARPEPVPVGTMVGVHRESDAKEITLVGDGRRFDLPTHVPPGTYKVLAATTPGLPENTGTIVVPPDARVDVKCVNKRCLALR